MALSAANEDIRYNELDKSLPRAVEVDTANTVHTGGFYVTDVTTGFAQVPASTATDVSLGFAQAGAVAGDIGKFQYGMVVSIPLASAAAADIGKTLYASSDNVFTLTSTNNQAVGIIDYLDPNRPTTHVYCRVTLGR